MKKKFSLSIKHSETFEIEGKHYLIKELNGAQREAHQEYIHTRWVKNEKGEPTDLKPNSHIGARLASVSIYGCDEDGSNVQTTPAFTIEQLLEFPGSVLEDLIQDCQRTSNIGQSTADTKAEGKKD